MKVSTNFSSQTQQQVVQFIVRRCVNGVPPRGTMKAAQLKFNISRATCTRYWSAAKKQRDRGETIQIVNNKKRVVRMKVVHLDITLLKSLHYTKRCNIRALAIGLGCSKSTFGRWVKAGLIRSHTSAIRPDLTAPNKLLRLRFTLDALELDRVLKII
ncbi:hypothetical protein SASPL_105405 [Salvia splendens]|uniref:Uncharacterized protein n=1 Tax=Salvia splendens TaxID=180675 RepID=A0A8X8YQD5_SALSN|nr:hypothetical protein SASPL_105405 [Salvia splendens]